MSRWFSQLLVGVSILGAAFTSPTLLARAQFYSKPVRALPQPHQVLFAPPDSLAFHCQSGQSRVFDFIEIDSILDSGSLDPIASCGSDQFSRDVLVERLEELCRQALQFRVGNLEYNFLHSVKAEIISFDGQTVLSIRIPEESRTFFSDLALDGQSKSVISTIETLCETHSATLPKANATSAILVAWADPDLRTKGGEPSTKYETPSAHAIKVTNLISRKIFYEADPNTLTTFRAIIGAGEYLRNAPLPTFGIGPEGTANYSNAQIARLQDQIPTAINSLTEYGKGNKDRALRHLHGTLKDLPKGIIDKAINWTEGGPEINEKFFETLQSGHRAALTAAVEGALLVYKASKDTTQSAFVTTVSKAIGVPPHQLSKAPLTKREVLILAGLLTNKMTGPTILHFLKKEGLLEDDSEAGMKKLEGEIEYLKNPVQLAPDASTYGGDKKIDRNIDSHKLADAAIKEALKQLPPPKFEAALPNPAQDSSKSSLEHRYDNARNDDERRAILNEFSSNIAEAQAFTDGAATLADTFILISSAGSNPKDVAVTRAVARTTFGVMKLVVTQALIKANVALAAKLGLSALGPVGWVAAGLSLIHDLLEALFGGGVDTERILKAIDSVNDNINALRSELREHVAGLHYHLEAGFKQMSAEMNAYHADLALRMSALESRLVDLTQTVQENARKAAEAEKALLDGVIGQALIALRERRTALINQVEPHDSAGFVKTYFDLHNKAITMSTEQLPILRLGLDAATANGILYDKRALFSTPALLSYNFADYLGILGGLGILDPIHVSGTSIRPLPWYEATEALAKAISIEPERMQKIYEKGSQSESLLNERIGHLDAILSAGLNHEATLRNFGEKDSSGAIPVQKALAHYRKSVQNLSELAFNTIQTCLSGSATQGSDRHIPYDRHSPPNQPLPDGVTLNSLIRRHHESSDTTIMKCGDVPSTEFRDVNKLEIPTVLPDGTEHQYRIDYDKMLGHLIPNELKRAEMLEPGRLKVCLSKFNEHWLPKTKFRRGTGGGSSFDYVDRGSIFVKIKVSWKNSEGKDQKILERLIRSQESDMRVYRIPTITNNVSDAQLDDMFDRRRIADGKDGGDGIYGRLIFPPKDSEAAMMQTLFRGYVKEIEHGGDLPGPDGKPIFVYRDMLDRFAKDSEVVDPAEEKATREEMKRAVAEAQGRIEEMLASKSEACETQARKEIIHRNPPFAAKLDAIDMALTNVAQTGSIATGKFEGGYLSYEGTLDALGRERLWNSNRIVELVESGISFVPEKTTQQTEEPKVAMVDRTVLLDDLMHTSLNAKDQPGGEAAMKWLRALALQPMNRWVRRADLEKVADALVAAEKDKLTGEIAKDSVAEIPLSLELLKHALDRTSYQGHVPTLSEWTHSRIEQVSALYGNIPSMDTNPSVDAPMSKMLHSLIAWRNQNVPGHLEIPEVQAASDGVTLLNLIQDQALQVLPCPDSKAEHSVYLSPTAHRSLFYLLDEDIVRAADAGVGRLTICLDAVNGRTISRGQTFQSISDVLSESSPVKLRLSFLELRGPVPEWIPIRLGPDKVVTKDGKSYFINTWRTNRLVNTVRAKGAKVDVGEPVDGSSLTVSVEQDATDLLKAIEENEKWFGEELPPEFREP